MVTPYTCTKSLNWHDSESNPLLNNGSVYKMFTNLTQAVPLRKNKNRDPPYVLNKDKNKL